MTDNQSTHPESDLTTEDQSTRLTKVSFYLRADQLEKLDDLAYEYNKQHRKKRKRIDRQDIIRFAIDQLTSDSLSRLDLDHPL